MNKKSIAKSILQKRNFLKKSVVEAFSKQILSNFVKFQHISKNQLVAGYYPINNEVDDILILNYLRTKGISVLLPSISDSKILSFKKYTDELIYGKFNIKEPNSKKIFLPDIILAPLVAFDNTGNRIGYGGGYYDATLNYYKSIEYKVLYIGIAYSFQEVEKINVSSFDVKLDAIVTEKEYKYFDIKQPKD